MNRNPKITNIHKQAKHVYKNDTTQERLDHVKAKEGQLTELNK